MMGLRFTGEIPFHEVLFHATILGTDGARMSKSSGNVVNPLDMVEVRGETHSGPGRQRRHGSQDSSLTRVGSRGLPLRQQALEHDQAAPPGQLPRPGGGGRTPQPRPSRCPISPARRPRRLDPLPSWRRSPGQGPGAAQLRLRRRTASIYDFAWHELADWYLELIKERLQAEQAARWVTRTRCSTAPRPRRRPSHRCPPHPHPGQQVRRDPRKPYPRSQPPDAPTAGCRPRRSGPWTGAESWSLSGSAQRAPGRDQVHRHSSRSRSS